MEPLILKNKGQRIFGILHLPEKRKGKAPLVVLCHGWTGNHLGTWNAFFTNAANDLAKKGYAVFRFDFRGNGNSDGVFEQQTITSMLSDLETVVGVLAKRKEVDDNRIALIGHSQGAYIALFYATKDNRVKTLISWMGRFSDYKDFASKTWLEEAERKGFLHFGEGYTIQYDTYIKDSMKYNSRKALRKLKIPLGLLYGEADDTVPISEGEKARKETGGKAEIKILKELSHEFTGKPGIQKQTIAITEHWLKRWL
ncbi:MAG: hypothetical protein Greene071421_378 [Parcubacteria group bacterium Greene0714_21]|nr:MAG: hypothetical protein Greene041639_31 [Parcubacteria group bacterium Greene0416_39]TSC98361.1 MAG: hypothetical protein Greene101447_104 [Parcubacteria group bacterium Greene1014_47]TSD04012.1 MAG: hypothetical protein Greene071421_378 [Parcubacteria group bacterium Greene0714_21]